MRRQHTVLIPLLLFISIPAAAKPKGSWEDVRRLARGTRISVKDFRFLPATKCYLEWADDQRLACVPVEEDRVTPPFPMPIPVPIPSSPPASISQVPVVYERRWIQRIRRDHSDDDNAQFAGAVAVGAAIGLTAARDRRELGGAILLAPLWYLMGWAFGHMFPILHGRVIYSR